MENIQNIEQKKTWITPELMIEAVKGTEGKTSTQVLEDGTLYGPS